MTTPTSPSPPSPFSLTTWTVVAVGILCAAFIILNLLPVWHTDVWAHMKFGQWIVEHRQLPAREPFADLADKDAPLINFQWLSQLLFYITFELGAGMAGEDKLRQLAAGAQFLTTLHALVVVVRWGILFAALRRLTGSPAVACGGMVVGMILSVPYVAVLRPQALAEVLFAALLYGLSAPILSKRGLIAVPLIMVLWANVHGSFPVGPVLLAGCLAGRLVQVCLEAGTQSIGVLLRDAASQRLGIALLLATVAACINPHGPWLYKEAFDLSRNPNIADMDEWRSLPWGTPAMYLFLGSLGLVALTLLLRWRLAPAPVRSTQYSVLSTEGAASEGSRAGSPPLIEPTQLILLLGSGIQTYLYLRMIPWWAMLVPWLLAPHWQAMLGQSRPVEPERATSSLRMTILAVALVLLGLRFSGVVQFFWDGDPKPLERVLHPGTPWQLAAQLKGQPQELKPLAEWLARRPGGRVQGRIFATESQGDYLLWSLPPDMAIFVYAHVHLFPPAVWEECQRVKAGAANWEAILDRHGVNLIVFECEEHARLRERLREARDRWLIVLDETGDAKKPDKRMRVMIAVRK